MGAAPKLLRFLSWRSLAALRALPTSATTPRLLAGPYATPPTLLPRRHPLPYGPAAPQPTSATSSSACYFPRPTEAPPPPPSSASALPPSRTTATPLPTTASATPPHGLKWRQAEVSSATQCTRSFTYARSSTPAQPPHRRLPCVGVAGAVSPTTSPGLISGMPTWWRYSPICSFSTNTTGENPSEGAPAGENPSEGVRTVENPRLPDLEVEGQKSEKVLDYFRKNPILLKVPVTTTPSDHSLITFNANHPYMIEEAAKRSLRSLLLRIARMHTEDKCMSSIISVDNILATSTGTLFFSEAETEDLTDDGVNKNWADLKNCIVSMMTEIHGNEVITELPGGFNHLLTEMTDASRDRSYLLPNHASLLPVTTRAIAVLKIYMLLVEELPKIDKTHAKLATDVLEKGAEPYTQLNHWFDIATNDPMLCNWLNYRGGRLYKRDESRSLMVLHRHVTHHCMEHKSKSPSGDYTFEAVQCLLEHTFSEFIPRVQFALWDHQLLKPLRLHALFTSSQEAYDS